MIRWYLRVSTEEQGDSGAGIEAQRRALRFRYPFEDLPLAAGGEGTALCREYVDTASGKTLDRPQLNELLHDIEPGDTLAVAKLDRLSRSVGDFAALLDTAASGGWAIVALDLGVDTTTPTGKLVANVMISVAQWEREIIGQRTREALAERKAAGVTLGRPVEVSSDVEDLVVLMYTSGFSLQEMADQLDSDGYKPPRSDTWHKSTVARIVSRLLKEGRLRRA